MASATKIMSTTKNIKIQNNMFIAKPLSINYNNIKKEYLKICSIEKKTNSYNPVFLFFFLYWLLDYLKISQIFHNFLLQLLELMV